MPTSPVLNARLTRACDTNAVQSNTDAQVNVCSLKRAREDLPRNPCGAPKKAKRSKKAARNGADRSSSDCADDKPRVGCPYYKKDGTLKQASCNGKGWPDPGKMKDHLKSVHKVPLEWLNEHIHFKEKPYFGEPIGVQWKLAFCRLFPEVPKDEVPSPYVNDVNPPLRTAVANKDLDVLGELIKHKLLNYYRIELLCELPIQDLEATLTNTFADAVADWKDGASIHTAISNEHDLLRIWSQTEGPGHTAPPTSMDHLIVPNDEEQSPQSCNVLPMNPIIKLEECDDEFSDTEHWTSDPDLDVKPALEHTSFESGDQKVEVNLRLMASTRSTMDRTSASEEPSSPVMMPFGQEYPFLGTPSSHSNQTCHGRSIPEIELYFEDPFVGPQISFSASFTDFSTTTPALLKAPHGEDQSPNADVDFGDWLSANPYDYYNDEAMENDQ